MPLHRKMILITLVLFSLLIGLVYALQFTHTRDYLAKQMLSDVDNTLNALGLTLVPHLQNEDLAAVQTTLNAVFDGGSFREIRFIRLADGAQVSRERDHRIDGVPAWFTGLALFEPVARSNTLTSGWLQLGELTVVGDPANAYEQLWNLSVQILFWFGVAALIVVALLLYTTRRLFRPLVALEARANEIAEQKFSHPMPDPDLIELKSLVRAFNAMAQKLQQFFNRQAEETEQLRVAAYEDPLTGLGNRAFFNSEMEQWLAEPTAGGLIFIQLYQLERIADEKGYQLRDELVSEVAEQLRALRREHPYLLLSRLSDDEMALIAPGCDPMALQHLVEELDLRVSRAIMALSLPLGRMHAIGAALRDPLAASGDLMARADSALKQAWMSNACAWQITDTDQKLPSLGRSQWRELILDAIREDTLVYQLQPVLSLKGKVRGLELFSAIRQKGILYPAAQFMPFVEQYGLGAEYDRHVLNQIAAHIARLRVPVVVNLSESAIGNVAFVNWLAEWLDADMGLRNLIGFELPESALVSQQGSLKTLSRILRRQQVQFGFDRIGRHLEQLKLLAELGPDYLKVDRSLVLCTEEEDRGFLKSLARLSHDLDIDLIAVRIEDQAQLDQLAQRSIDGYQGYIRPPVNWKPGQKVD